MATLQTGKLNADILRNLGIIAENEGMLNRAAKYLRRLAKELSDDPTQMTKEDFFAKIKRSEEEYAQGKYYEMLPEESLDDFLKRIE